MSRQKLTCIEAALFCSPSGIKQLSTYGMVLQLDYF